jgi:hypothetical protein
VQQLLTHVLPLANLQEAILQGIEFLACKCGAPATALTTNDSNTSSSTTTTATAAAAATLSSVNSDDAKRNRRTLAILGVRAVAR